MIGPEDVDDELDTEVTDECSKFGVVEKVVIYQEKRDSDEIVVKVIVLFQDAVGAQKAQAHLQGRYFAGRVVQADFFDEKKFLAEDFSG